MTDVFISYSVKDEELAQFVRSHLTAQGLTVFLASISLVPGERWTPKIIDSHQHHLGKLFDQVIQRVQNFARRKRHPHPRGSR